MSDPEIHVAPEVAAFLDRPHLATLATVNSRGEPQASVIWFAFDGEEIDFFVEDRSVKARNLRANPRVVLTVATADWPYREAIVSGRVEELAYDADLARRIAVRYRGSRDGDAMHRSMDRHQQRVRFRLRPSRVSWIDMSGWDFHAA